MLFAEFPESIELDEIADGAGPRFAPHCLEQTQFDPAGRLAVFDAQVRADLTQAHRIPAQIRVLLPVEKVIQALRLIAETKRSSLDAMIRDVFDQLIRLPTIKFVSRCGARPLNAVLVEESPAGASIIAGNFFEFSAQRGRVFGLPDDLERFGWPLSPPPRLGGWIDRERRHTSPLSPCTHR